MVASVAHGFWKLDQLPHMMVSGNPDSKTYTVSPPPLSVGQTKGPNQPTRLEPLGSGDMVASPKVVWDSTSLFGKSLQIASFSSDSLEV